MILITRLTQITYKGLLRFNFHNTSSSLLSWEKQGREGSVDWLGDDQSRTVWLSKTVVYFVFETHEQNLIYTAELWSHLFLVCGNGLQVNFWYLGPGVNTSCTVSRMPERWLIGDPSFIKEINFSLCCQGALLIITNIPSMFACRCFPHPICGFFYLLWNTSVFLGDSLGTVY